MVLATHDILRAIPAASEQTPFIRLVHPPFALNHVLLSLRQANAILRAWSADEIMVIECSTATVAATFHQIASGGAMRGNGGNNLLLEFLTVGPDSFVPDEETMRKVENVPANSGSRTPVPVIEATTNPAVTLNLALSSVGNYICSGSGSGACCKRATSLPSTPPKINAPPQGTDTPCTPSSLRSQSRNLRPTSKWSNVSSRRGQLERGHTPPSPSPRRKMNIGNLDKKSVLENFNNVVNVRETNNGEVKTADVQQQGALKMEVEKNLSQQELDVVEAKYTVLKGPQPKDTQPKDTEPKDPKSITENTTENISEAGIEQNSCEHVAHDANTDIEKKFSENVAENANKINVERKATKKYDRKKGQYGGRRRIAADRAFAKSEEGRLGIMGLFTQWWQLDL